MSSWSSRASAPTSRPAARPLIHRQGITLVGISVANLDDNDALQLILPFGRRHRSAATTGRGAIDAALDDVRSRFGTTAVTRAVLLGRDDQSDVPLLPD